MNRNQWIDNCPACEEILWKFFFKKSFIPEDPVRGGWSGVEAYYCAGCDQLLIVAGFAKPWTLTAMTAMTFFHLIIQEKSPLAHY